LLKKIKQAFHKNKKEKLVVKLTEELSELQKELLKCRLKKCCEEIGDCLALIKMFGQVFDCKKEIKENTKKSFKKWKYLIK
jgi:NTP pyrophosphatase (non-canonical NTP hydrolase)